ncbi:MAG: glutamate--tRNA ligase [Clostridia bacterium]|nr:glutamate--tRNA ligase [Clostridia bacterium]
MKVRTRFAPSPTGFMHIGNLRTALYSYLFARHHGGEFILRIEDTDRERFVEGAVDLVYRTMDTVGIKIDESPIHGGEFGPYVQSERKEIYKEYAHKLVELGGAYYCFCDKERLESLTDENGNRKYDKHCLKLTKEEIEEKLKAGVPYVNRQNIPESGMTSYQDLVYGQIDVDCADLEDNVLLKSDGMPTYNFANVVDDHLMQITHVTRGNEYLSSTPKYNLIYKSFGWEPPKYIHLPPIMKDAQRKLSKRYGDANFEDFIGKGYLPEAIVNYIALLGWAPKSDIEKMDVDTLTELFDVDGISKSGSIFDEAKMKWLNSLYIKELSPERFSALAKPWYEKSVIAGKYDYEKWNALLQSRVEVLSDILDKVAFIEEFGDYDLELFYHKKLKADASVGLVALKGAREALEAIEDFSEENVSLALAEKAEAMEMKKGQMLWSVRVGLTGAAVTPGGAVEMAGILGKEKSLERLDYSIKMIESKL